jgi:predicted phosphodiesterase
VEWKAEAYRLNYEENLSYSEIGKILFPDMDSHASGQKVRGYMRTTDRYIAEHSKNGIVRGVFGDIHAPFTHPNYMRFVKDTFKRFGVKEIICTGDLVDHHALSRFQSSTSAKGATDEHKAAQEEVGKVFDMFRKGKLCIGNHDLIFERQAATLGIGTEYLKSFREVYGVPKGWEIAEEFVIDNVLYKHGINCLGKDGALNTAIQERMSTVIGHSHSFGGVKYSANKRSIIFGMNVGCGIDIEAYAFEYGKHAKFRPTLGCGIVFSDSCAIFCPMSSEYFRSNA